MLALALLVAVAAIALVVADRRRWVWAEPTLDRLELARAWVTAVILLAPATAICLLVLGVTTWVVRSSDPA